VDSSALVKLAIQEPESQRLSRYLRGRVAVSSALARTEVARATMPLGEPAVRHGREVVGRLELVRISDRILNAAAALEPPELRTLDAIHLATAQLFGATLSVVVTYDQRLAEAARRLGMRVSAPA
jgi:predicted nucleic acid-binding protein